MSEKHTSTTPDSPEFKIITFTPHIAEDSIRAQHEIEMLMHQGWSLIRATTSQTGAPSVVLLERLK